MLRNQIKFLIGLGVFFGLSAGAVAGLLFFINSNPDSGPGIFDSLGEAVSKSASTIEIDRAVRQAIERHPEVLAYTIYDVEVDHVDFSPDGQLALAWLSLSDKKTGDVLPAEPGLAIVVRSGEDSKSWTATVQADATWNEQIALVPADMLNEEARIQFTSPDQPISKAIPFTGYRLPWAKGSKKMLTGSIGHVFTYKSCPSSCLYAFDFADGTMFQVLAAKGGVVKQAVWGYPNGNTTNANYLLIEDSSTSPVSYMIYLHFAQNSIPEALRTPGAVVRQGQFLGNADDTGYSTGHHLHFHVHTNPTSYWGNSVDIQFEDVTINGGRPRTCSEANAYPEYGGQCLTADTYTSGNGDSTAPYGGLSLPQAGQTINTASITVSGWGKDDTAVTKMQPVVNYDGIWRPVGSPQTVSPFSTDINLCEAGVPDGPISIGLIVYDRAGNQSVQPQGQRVLTKQFACEPQPVVCQPSDDQAAIFVNKNHQGPCQLLDIGNYPDLGTFPTFGDNNLESILVGANVTAAVFDGAVYKDRVESLTSGDENFSDNLIGLDRASSIRVLKNPITPAAPVLNLPSVSGGGNVTSQDSIVLTWVPAVGAVDYRGELNGSNGFSTSLDWNKADSWSVGSLPAGEYDWAVWTRNGEKENQASASFSVSEAALSASPPLTVPYKADFESKAAGWSATGYWKLGTLTWGDLSTTAWYTGDTESFASGSDRAASLTSPSIQIPYEGLALQFTMFTETESPSIFRDQRWVQISEDGGPFRNVLQILDPTDPDTWIENKSIDLKPYAGHTIRVRFHFDAVDTFYNNYFSWGIDDIQIQADVSQVCGDQPSDETPQNASEIQLPAGVDGSLCPDGDVDTFKFLAVKDQNITAVVSIPESGLAWNPVLSITSAGGETLTAVSNSSAAAAFFLTAKAPETGEYYLKVTSSNDDAVLQLKPYSLRVISDGSAPRITVLAPTADQPLTGFPFTISLDVTDDEGSGVAGLEFWWHTKSWANDKWELLGTDLDGSDGWSWTIPSGFVEPPEGAALFLRASDFSENYQGVTLTANPLDSAPSSHLLPLPSETATTAVHLTWEVDANPGNIQTFRIQYREGENDWTDVDALLEASDRQAWFIGLNGVNYQFRLSAVDSTGREEVWPDEPESLTSIETSCTPDKSESGSDEGQPDDPAVLELNHEKTGLNFCPPGDTDWYQFSAVKEKTYTIKAMPVEGGGAASVLQILTSDRQTVLAEAAALDLSSPTVMDWEALEDGNFIVRVSALNPGVSGSGAGYTLRVDQGGAFSIPGMVCGAALIPALLFMVKVVSSLFKKRE